MAPRQCCVPSCTVIQGEGVPLHGFPNPSKPDEIERFRTWVMRIGGNIVGENDEVIFKNRRICHRHFEVRYTFPNLRLTKLAIPTLHLPGLPDASRTMPMNQDVHRNPEVQANTEPASVDALSAQPSTSGAQPLPRAPIHGLQVASRPMPMNQDVPRNPEVQANTESASVDALSAQPSTSGAQPPPRAPIHGSKVLLRSKAMSKIERELRDTLAATRATLRRCQRSKDMFKTKLILANKVMKTEAFQLAGKQMSPAAQTFFKMQVSQFGKRPRGRRFSLDEKIFALSVYKPCPKAYRLLEKICILPKRRTLDKILQKVHLLPGINDIIFENLKKRVQKMPNHHKFCAIMFDEMALAPHVSFDKTRDTIYGFVDNGTTREKEFSHHVLVFMIRGVIKKYKQPVAFTFCSGTTKTLDLKRQIALVIKKVTEAGLNVIGTICDQGSTNMAAINLLLKDTQEAYLKKNIEYRGGFFEINDKKIYPIYDPPHIMKGIRNNLLTKDLEYVMEGRTRRAKWAHVEALYRRGPGYKGVRLAKKLTAQHVSPNLIPKMKVKFCTQVFSENVGATMGFMAGIGKLPIESIDTADLLLFFDKLFDSVNGCYSEPTKGKVYRSAVTPRSPHHKLWYKSLRTLRTMKYITQSGSRTVVPSITSWIKSIEYFQAITKHLHSLGLNSLLLRNFNQDPLENFFGAIRAHGLRNTMPSSYSFVNSYKALMINNLTSPHSVGSNCEEDDNYCLQSLKFFLTEKIVIPENPDEKEMSVDDAHFLIEDIDTDNLIQTQKEKSAAVAYCSGWLVKLCKKKVYKSCNKCKGDLESENVQDFHEYIKIREYRPDKTWLLYPTRRVFDTFCQIENICIEILKSSCHKERLTEYIELIATIQLSFSFLTCEKHRAHLSKFILKRSIIFFVNNWCREINEIISGKTTFWDEEDMIKQAAHNYYLKHKVRR